MTGASTLSRRRVATFILRESPFKASSRCRATERVGSASPSLSPRPQTLVRETRSERPLAASKKSARRRKSDSRDYPELVSLGRPRQRTATPRRARASAMWHRDVSASSVYHRSAHRRGRDPVCVVRRAPNARSGDEPARDGARERQHIHRRRPDDSPRRTASHHPRVTRETDPRTTPPHRRRSDARADSPSARDLRAHVVSPDDARRREADAETAARREWDAYWEDLHRRSRIGLVRSGNLSGTAARRRFGPPLTLGEWGRGYARLDARTPLVPGTGAARMSASADALAALREEPGGFFSDADDDEAIFSGDDFFDDEVASAETSSPQRRGVSPRTLRRIPSVSYGTPACATSDERKDATSSSARARRRGFDTECAVCLCEYAPREPLARLPACGHLFHRACVERWLRTSRECPKCRAAVVSVGEKEGDAGDAEGDDAKTGEGTIVVACSPERFSSLML